MSQMQGPEGNVYDKHNNKNPLVRFLMWRFHHVLCYFIAQARPVRIVDVGCGEGYTTELIKRKFLGVHIEGIELGENVLKKARVLHNEIHFEQGSIYSIKRANKSYDLVVCTEVLEHLDAPRDGLRELKRVSKRFVVVTVPNEPWWRIMNILRLSYLKAWGNTPGHINHWSKKSFVKFLTPHFDKVTVKNALVWNVALCEKK